MTRAAIARWIALAALLSVFSIVEVGAQEPQTSLVVEPDTGLTVGDPVELQLTITHEPGSRILLDSSVVQLGGMEPSAPQITELSQTETLVTFRTRAFTAATFEVELPDIPIQRADGVLTELKPQTVAITIASVLDRESEPRPITPPDLLQGDGQTFTPWIVAIIGVGLGFILARLLRRRYRRPAAAAVLPDAEAPAAERQAFALDGSLAAADQCRQLARAVRSRLGDDWSLPASALTAGEIGPALAAAGAPGVIVLRATRLLEACDRVQYGGEQPTPERLEGYVQLAEAIWSDGASS